MFPTEDCPIISSDEPLFPGSRAIKGPLGKNENEKYMLFDYKQITVKMTEAK